ncbi:hypothetical protein QAD02_012797 [Eretmocerus hayati]|uniref:Uncharacterized protein n=1 Tax=Eretmocerus hayati TaxID=131215 RepID=A0ACC2P5G1_9HYME|nr:hypothetical protein QAD02_012797 [Eretmocerus hayati]
MQTTLMKTQHSRRSALIGAVSQMLASGDNAGNCYTGENRDLHNLSDWNDAFNAWRNLVLDNLKLDVQTKTASWRPKTSLAMAPVTCLSQRKAEESEKLHLNPRNMR